MADSDYEVWWSLHLRVAKGESLSEQEESFYRQGLDHLDSQPESTHDDILPYLRSLRAAIERATTFHAQLSAQSRELDGKIAALEENFQQLTGTTLGLDPYAPA